MKEKEEISSDNLDKDNDLENNSSDGSSIDKCIQADQQDNLSGTITIESIEDKDEGDQLPEEADTSIPGIQQSSKKTVWYDKLIWVINYIRGL